MKNIESETRVGMWRSAHVDRTDTTKWTTDVLPERYQRTSFKQVIGWSPERNPDQTCTERSNFAPSEEDLREAFALERRLNRLKEK